MVENSGLPGWLAYGTYLGEFVAPLLVMIGKFTRPAGLLIAFNMLMTILVAHLDIALQRNEFGGWLIELNALLLLGGLAVALLGPGRYSLSGGVGRWALMLFPAFGSFSGNCTSMPLPTASHFSRSVLPSKRTCLMFLVENVDTHSFEGNAGSSASGR